MTTGPVPFEFAIWVLGGLLTCIGALLAYLFSQINRKQNEQAVSQAEMAKSIDHRFEHMENKLDEFNESNHDDHKQVEKRLRDIESRLMKVETRLDGIIQRNTEKDEA